jgi:CubicO group peptidase (beta-lactamase class C family)
MLKFISITALIFSVLFSFADENADKLDKILTDYNNIEMISGVVLLAKDGAPVFEKAYGYADWEQKTPNTTATLFNICSLNKMFTHTTILQLQQEGKLSVNDPLNKYLNLYPDAIGGKITIQMLLDMKAGLNDYLSDPAYINNIEKFKTVNDYLEIIKNEPLLFEPGTGEEYSNSGYAVLGGIIEKVTGKSYTDNLKERFFEPLGIKNAYYRQIGDNVPNASVPAKINYDGSKKNMQYKTMPSPAGGLFMNAEDLLKFDNYLRKANLLFQATRAGGSPGWNSVFAQYKNGYTLLITGNLSHIAEQVEFRFRSAMNGKEYPAPSLPINMKMYKALKENGIDYLEQNLKTYIQQEGLEYNDIHLNMFGYELMQSGELDMAIAVFTLNTKLFPDVANVFDSLGEAYMNKGDKENAISSYKKVLAIQPGNQNAKKQLEKLGN